MGVYWGVVYTAISRYVCHSSSSIQMKQKLSDWIYEGAFEDRESTAGGRQSPNRSSASSGVQASITSTSL